MRCLFLILLFSNSDLFAQSPEGKLYYFTGTGGIPPPYLGYIEYPDADSFVVIAEVQTLDIAAKDGQLFAAALFGVIVYDTLNHTPLDTIQVSYPRHIAVWGDKLAVTSATNPYFRVYDLQSKNLDFSLDTLKVPLEPSDLVVSNDKAFLLFGSSVMVVDLLLQDTIATVATHHPFGFGGFNYFLVDAGDDLYIDVEYATGALRFSLMRMNKLTLEVDTVFHQEGYANYSEPIAVNDKIYLGAFNSHYDITNDSLYISQSMFWPIAIEYDEISEAVFLSNSPGNTINYFLNGNFSDTIIVDGIVSKALFVPEQEDTLNDISERGTRELIVSPNPVSGFLHVKLPEAEQIKSIELYEITGKKVADEEIVFVNKELLIDYINLPTGYYFLKINVHNENLFTRFIKY